MVVMVPKEDLIEHRLDELEKKVDGGFANVAEEFGRVDKKIDAGFARVDSDVHELRGEIGKLRQVLYGGTVAVIVTVLGSNVLS
jgi:tetrahydromethanopterin S-methyltransferase subunit G